MKNKISALSICSAALLSSAPCFGRAGTHPTPVSTWDMRASTIVGAFRYGFIDGGQMMQASYNANFSSTTGNLSAQFGLHYMNYQHPEVLPGSDLKRPLAHGIGGTSAAVFSIPISDRHPDGIPLAAFGFYLGGAPAALVGGEFTYLTVPLTLGISLPYSPHPIITLVPWFEAAPSVNLDTEFVETNITLPPEALSDPNEIRLSPEIVAGVLAQGVQTTVSARVNMRAGLHAILHASDSVDFDVYFNVGSLDSTFTGPTVFTLGGSLVIRWDDIVPAVLPPERRLERIDCEAVETRFRQCPGGQRWQQLEERFEAQRAAEREARAKRRGAHQGSETKRGANKSGLPYGEPEPPSEAPEPETAPAEPPSTPEPTPEPTAPTQQFPDSQPSKNPSGGGVPGFN